jgi:hypothetical protein
MGMKMSIAMNGIVTDTTSLAWIWLSEVILTPLYEWFFEVDECRTQEALRFGAVVVTCDHFCMHADLKMSHSHKVSTNMILDTL